jgi:hypothetical protein
LSVSFFLATNALADRQAGERARIGNRLIDTVADLEVLSQIEFACAPTFLSLVAGSRYVFFVCDWSVHGSFFLSFVKRQCDTTPPVVRGACLCKSYRRTIELCIDPFA